MPGPLRHAFNQFVDARQKEFLVAYLSMGSIAILLGILARARGLATAVDWGAEIIVLLSLSTVVAVRPRERIRAGRVNPSPKLRGVSTT